MPEAQRNYIVELVASGDLTSSEIAEAAKSALPYDPRKGFSEQELTRLIGEKKVVKETYVWMPNLPSWKIAEQIPEVLKLVALAPPPFDKNI